MYTYNAGSGRRAIRRHTRVVELVEEFVKPFSSFFSSLFSLLAYTYVNLMSEKDESKKAQKTDTEPDQTDLGHKTRCVPNE